MISDSYTKGFVCGAIAYARKRGDSPVLGNNQVLAEALAASNLSAFKHCANPDKDWRVGHLASPRTDDSPFFHASMNNIYQFQVVAVHPSGTQGIECRDGVLEMKTYYQSKEVGQTLFAPADEWCVA